MTVLIALFGAAIAALGILGFVRPSRLVGFGTSTFQSRAGLYWAMGMRVVLGRDFRFGHPDTVRVLPSAARMQDLGSPLTVDAPFAPDSVAECRFIAAFQLAGGLFADTAP